MSVYDKSIRVDPAKVKITASRLTSNQPIGFRWLVKLSGDKVFQGAYPWTQGSMGGFEWRELDTVYESEIGRAM
jgi:hypothetical protein